MYDIALLEKPCEEGLDMEEILYLCDKLEMSTHISPNDEIRVYPIEIEAKLVSSSAMGFIIENAAEALCFDYEKSGLCDFVSSILDDMNNETEDGHYRFKGMDIYLTR